MERSDYYFKHIIFQKVRVGTRVPLINRDPHNLPIKHKANEEWNNNMKRNHSLIQGVNYHELKERNFNHNEQIKLMLRSLRGFQKTINTTFAVNNNNITNNISSHKLLTPITSRKNKVIIDQQQQQQPLGLVNNLRKVASSSQILFPLNDNNGSSSSQVNKSLHLTPIKRLQRNQSQSQSLQISKSESKRKLKLLSGVRIKNVFSRTRTGETAETIKNMLLAASQAKKKQNQKNKKTKNENTPLLLTPTLPVPKPKRNEDAVITKWDFISKTFGKVSLFGVLNGIGINGYYISHLLRNYFIDYFENQSIETSMNKDNFYTILSQAFTNANTFLKNCKYDCDFSGATGLLLFFPEGHDDIIYCANAGHSKAVAYSHTQSYPLSYEHYPSLISEKERIQKKGGNVNGELITMSSNTLNKIYQQLNAKNIDITKYRDEFTNGFRIARTMGCFYWEEAGVIADPQVVECNLKREDTKAIVIGTDGLWKYLQIDQVGEIVMRYYEENNIFGACKELEETARLKWRKYSKEVDDISVIVLFLQWEKVKV